MKKFIFYLCFVFCFLFYYNLSVAEIINKIEIVGNKRIQPDTIIEYGKIKKNINYSVNEINNFQKNIFETGFFENVKVKLENNILKIYIIENPLINFYNIQGDIGSEDINKFYDLLKLGNSKIYSEYYFKKDLDYIKSYYIDRGYYGVEVNPRISKIEDNKLNILLTVNKNEQTKINRIYFIGRKVFNSSDLKDVISSTEHGWWKFLSSTSILSQERISYDKESLKKYYLNNGYFDVQIPSVDIKKINKDRVDIIFSINAGILYNFGSLQIIEGENLINEEIRANIILLSNKLFKKNYSYQKIRNFLDSFNNLISKSKLEFVESDILQEKNEKNIDLKLKIISGKKIFIQKINVTGNSITDEAVIRRNLVFAEGDSYLDYKKDKSLDNLNATRIFKNVNINTQNLENGNVEINIKVIEQPTGSITGGAGYGSEGGVISFGLSEKNFLGSGVTFNSELNIGTQRVQGKAGVIVPDFMNSDKTLFGSLFATKTTLTNTLYESKKYGTDFATQYEIVDNVYLKPSYDIDFEEIKILPGASSYFLSQNGNYFTQKIGYNLEKDGRDKKFGTKSGSVLGFSQQIASFGSDIPFLKHNFYGSTFFSVLEKQVLNIKYGYSNITGINSSDSIKLSDRLFIPSQLSKGFEPRGYGPKDTGTGDFIGGNNSIYSSASITLPTPFQETWNLNTVAFINAFDVWGTDNNFTSDKKSIRSAFGIGLDWRSPLGPLNMSFTKPISKEDTDKTKLFSIEIGTVF